MYSSKKSGIIVTSMGIGILITTVISYPSFLPTTISSENAIWINQISYLFYILLVGSTILTAFGIRKTFRMWSDRTNISSSPSSSSLNPLSYCCSISEIIVNIVNDKKYFRFFWPASIGYGIFYALVSGMIIYRPDNISNFSGVAIPSVIVMSYGPVGYVPTMAAYFSEHIGLLVIPINLLVTFVIAALVGFNTVLSVYAFANRPKSITATSGSSSALSVLGATTSLFTACPTCASFYIFNIMTGSLASTIAAFAVVYYILFVAISIPLLLVTPFITALSIRRIMRSVSQCSLNMKESSN
jgi:hypothetical protein